MARLFSPVTTEYLMTTLVARCDTALKAMGVGTGGDRSLDGLRAVEEAISHSLLPPSVIEDLGGPSFGFDSVRARSSEKLKAFNPIEAIMGPCMVGDMAVIGCLSSKEGGTPLYYILYHDGIDLRGYVPLNGNSADAEERGGKIFDVDAIMANIAASILRRPGSPDATVAHPAGAPSVHPAFAGMLAPKEKRAYTRREAQALLDDLHEVGGLKVEKRIDIARMTNDHLARVLISTGAVKEAEFTGIVDDAGDAGVTEQDEAKVLKLHPDAVRFGLDKVQRNIADRIAGLIEFADTHGIGLRLVDGRLRVMKLDALNNGEDEASVARHYRELAPDVEIKIVRANLADPRHDDVMAEPVPETDLMAPIRAIVEQGRAVLNARGIESEGLSDHQVLISALRQNSFSPRVRDDLSRVKFGIADVVSTPTSRVPASLEVINLLGERGLPGPGNRVFIGLLGADRGESPVYFVLWHDGVETRAYVPEQGNMYDHAFGCALTAGKHKITFDVDAIVADLGDHL